MQMRGMQKRIKQKSWKIYTVCILGRLPMWVRHPSAISKHGASAIYTQPFYTEKTKLPWLHRQYLFLFYSVQITSYISTGRGTIWYFCTTCAFPDPGTLQLPQSDNHMCHFYATVSRGEGRRRAQRRTCLRMDQLQSLAQVLILSTLFFSAFPS